MKISHSEFSGAPFESRDADQYLDFLSSGINLVGAVDNQSWYRSMFQSAGFPLAIAPMLAHLSNLAYQNETDITGLRTICEAQLESDYGARYLARFENKNAEGYAFVLGDQAFVIFCGTNDLSSDWVDNLLAIRKEHDFGGRRSKDIHMGFARHFELLRPAIETWIEELPASITSFVCTGHSLGGSLAVLMAQLLGLSGKDVACVMTFGSPAVGGERFSKEYKWHKQTWRVVDLGDPIPKSTPEYVGFRHVGTSISSKTDFSARKLKNQLKPAPKNIAIFPKSVERDSLGNQLKDGQKSVAKKALELYRERPRHCKNVYRSSMQKLLEEYLPDLPSDVLRTHYDYCGMHEVELFRVVGRIEED